ncbi:MAG: FHA domain-containing protein [Chloroflexota bacterium]
MSKTDEVKNTTSKKLSTETTPLVEDSFLNDIAPSVGSDEEKEESTVPQLSVAAISEATPSEEAQKEDVSDELQAQSEKKTDVEEITQLGSAEQEAYSTESIVEGVEDDDNPHVNIGSVRLREQLVVTEQKTGTRFTFPSDDITEIVIGRRSTTVRAVLQIDLGDIIEPTDGISRKHASIVRQDGLLFIVDRDSRNGTYLNGQKLVPEQLRIVRDSDMIRLGRVVLNISYEAITTDNT